VSILVVFGKYAEGDPYPGEQGSLGEESRIGNLETENHEAFLHCQNDGGGKRETQTYTLYPREHWRCIRTNNPMERIMRENRRKKKVVGNFSVGRSALMLVAARLRYISGRAY
jgi:hypothetical protein